MAFFDLFRGKQPLTDDRRQEISNYYRSGAEAIVERLMNSDRSIDFQLRFKSSVEETAELQQRTMKKFRLSQAEFDSLGLVKRADWLNSVEVIQVAVFAVDRGAAKAARALGADVARIPPSSMFETADAALNLDGALQRFMIGRPFEIEVLPEMSGPDRMAFIRSRFMGKRWVHSEGETPTTHYTVVVVKS